MPGLRRTILPIGLALVIPVARLVTSGRRRNMRGEHRNHHWRIILGSTGSEVARSKARCNGRSWLGEYACQSKGRTSPIRAL